MVIARTRVVMASELRSLDLQNLVRIIGPVSEVGVLSNFQRLVLLSWLELMQQVVLAAAITKGFLAFYLIVLVIAEAGGDVDVGWGF